MPLFEYQATDKDGRTVRGTLLSASEQSASEQLLKRGLTVAQLGVPAGYEDLEPSFPKREARSEAVGQEGSPINPPPTEARAKVMTDVVGPLMNQVSLTALMFFFRQLATMQKAGLNIVQSLDTLSRQTTSPVLAGIISEMRGHAEAGRPISVGMQRYPEVFSPLVISLIRVGEESGNMDGSCENVAHYLEREIELRNLYRRVTFYPKLILVASMLIIGGANFIIGMIGRGQGLDAPLNRISTWLVLGPLIIGIFLFLRVGLRNPATKHAWDAMILRVPSVGKTLHLLSMAKFGRAFGALYAGGVPLSKCVQLGADSCGNEYIRGQIYPAAKQLEDGGGITEAFVRTGVFSPIVLDMTSTGERTGNLDFMLNKVAEFYEDEGRTRAIQFGYVFGVAVFLFVAIYVGFVVISFYSRMGAGYSDHLE